VSKGDSCTCWTLKTDKSSDNCYLYKGDPDHSRNEDNRISGKCGSNPPPPPHSGNWNDTFTKLDSDRWTLADDRCDHCEKGDECVNQRKEAASFGAI